MRDPLDRAVLSEVRRQVAEGAAVPDAESVAALVRRLGGVRGREDVALLRKAVLAEIAGAGPLQALLDEEGVSDVLVNGADGVWVDRGRGLERREVDLGTVADVRALAVRLASAGHQRLDEAAPVADARLPDGTRLHAVLPPIAGQGPLISLRVLRRRAFTLRQLQDAGTVAPSVARVLAALVERRLNVLVSGATGTGKTTLLSTLLSLVPVTERIVCLEEAGELNPTHPHVIRLLVRRPNVEGAGAVTLTDLVHHALRMRPDRVVLGECRGPEVRDVLTAFNTGHDGGWVTLHANRAEDVPTRLEALGALAGMGRDAVAAQAASALHAVVHLRRDAGVRYVAEVALLRRSRDGCLEVLPALTVLPASAPAADAGTEQRGTAVEARTVEYGAGWPGLATLLGLPPGAAGVGEQPGSFSGGAS